MNIEIKLKNPKYCDGCQCICFGGLFRGHWCSYFDIKLNFKPISWTKGYLIRPKKCIKENGV